MSKTTLILLAGAALVGIVAGIAAAKEENAKEKEPSDVSFDKKDIKETIKNAVNEGSGTGLIRCLISLLSLPIIRMICPGYKGDILNNTLSVWIIFEALRYVSNTFGAITMGLLCKAIPGVVNKAKAIGIAFVNNTLETAMTEVTIGAYLALGLFLSNATDAQWALFGKILVVYCFAVIIYGVVRVIKEKRAKKQAA